MEFKKQLQARGIDNLWLDEERLERNVIQEMTSGIDHSKLIILFLKKAYIEKIASRGPNGVNDNCSK